MRGVLCGASGVRFAADLKEPQPAANEVLLRVRAAGICDTDLQLARGYMGFRGVLGHEFVATDEHGRRVTAEINQVCGQCSFCAADTAGARRGMARHCPHRTVLGILNHDGAMAEWVAVDYRTVHLVPDEVDDRAAVFIEPLAAAFRVVEQLQAVDQTACAVLGDGKLGLLCAWVLQSRGACVTWIGKHPEKLALAGADIETRLVEEVRLDARKFEVVVDATGSPTGLADALRLVEPCGTVVLKTTVATEHELSMAPVVINEIRVLGSRCGAFGPVIEALRARRFNVNALIEGEYSLDDAERAFAAAARPGARKVLLWCD